MVGEIFNILKTLPEPKPIEHEEFTYEKEDPTSFKVYFDEADKAYIVDGAIVKLLSRNVVLNDMDSLAYMQKTLKKCGVFSELRRMGAKDGDTVIIGEIEFDFID